MSKHNPTGRTIRAAMGRAQGGGDDRTIRFVFSTPGVARDGHRILPGSWASKDHDGLTAFRANPVFLWAHDAEEPPIGRVIDISESSGILSGAVTFADTDFADTILRLYKDGFLNACSIGWTPIEGTPARGSDRAIGAYDFTKCELLEISGVPVPADVGALATARAAGLDLSPLAAWAERRIESKDVSMPTSELQALQRAAAGSAPRVFPMPKAPGASFRSLGEQAKAILNVRAGGVEDPRLQRAPAGNNELDPSGGGFLVGEQFVEKMVGSIYEQAIPAPLCSHIQTDGPLSSIKVPAVDETSRADGSRWGGAASYWAAEAGTVSASFPRFRQIEFSGKKLIAVVYASAELFEDAAMLEEHLTRALASEFAFKLDQAILAGTGAGQPLGLLNSSATITVAKASGQAAGTIVKENINSMWSRLASPSRRNAVWLMSEDAMAQIDAGSSNYQGVYGEPENGERFPRLKGAPVYEIEQASALGTVGDIVVVDMSQYQLVGSEMKTAISADVRFINNEIAFRFTMRIDGAPLWASPITPYNGTSTRSPFVTLAAR
jgi:HK97 family phage major capsid protein